MRNLQIERPGSFLPVYSLLLAALQLWLTWALHARGRSWMVYDPAAPARFLAVLLAVLLGLAALTMCFAAWLVLRRGVQRMNRTMFQASTVGCLLVLYALMTIAGYWLGFL